MGHARALLAVDDLSEQLRLFREIREGGYSVRKVEEMVKAVGDKQETKRARKSTTASSDFNLLQQHLAAFFKADVKLTCNPKGKGRIAISFKNEQELERIVSLLDQINANS